jgi:hypothetical protein
MTQSHRCIMLDMSMRSYRSGSASLIFVAGLVTACGGGRGETTNPFGSGPEGETGTADGATVGDGDGDGDGDPGDGDGDPGDGDGDSGTKFDLNNFPDSGDGLECGCGNNEWSYIWIANSAEHTVSKINTRTLIEEGRYYTRADQSGNPSRTSVSIDARAVVVANRMGGVTKIWAREADCVDKNNNGMIDTSTGPGDVRPFDADECIAWHSAIPDATVQRPVAWTSGVLNLSTCDYDDQKIWTATGQDSPMGDNYCGPSGTWIHRLNADTGVAEETIHIPENEVPCVFGGSPWGFGYYGGAVDPDNNLWLSTFGAGRLVRVDYQTLDYTVFNGSSYGITVDTMGRPWIGDSPQRFNENTNSYDPPPMGSLPGAGGSGIAEDHQGRMWAATSGGIGWVDRDTLEVGDTVLLPAQGLYRGISVDIDGFIWAIPLGGTEAFKIDPDTYAFESVGGLNGPYTYSDMTGGQLNNVNCYEPAG